MTEIPLVVARLKGGDQDKPRFTATATVEQLFAELTERLPVDKIYFVYQHPDGLGYSLQEAGVVICHLLAEGLQRPALPQSPLPLSPTLGGKEKIEPRANMSPKEDVVAKDWYPIEDLTHPEEDDTNPFKFEEPKSQRELGNEPPPPTQGQQAMAVSKAPKKTKTKAPKTSTTSKLVDEEDDKLPNPVSRGTLKSTGFQVATPDQAQRASNFGKVV